jgi:hypothetical protein
MKQSAIYKDGKQDMTSNRQWDTTGKRK